MHTNPALKFAIVLSVVVLAFISTVRAQSLKYFLVDFP